MEQQDLHDDAPEWANTLAVHACELTDNNGSKAQRKRSREGAARILLPSIAPKKKWVTQLGPILKAICSTLDIRSTKTASTTDLIQTLTKSKARTMMQHVENLGRSLPVEEFLKQIYLNSGRSIALHALKLSGRLS
jgi:hypothetical protein